MPKSDIEIEIKVQIEKPAPLLKFLKAHGKFIARDHQVDEYFIPAHRDFTSVRPVSEWLRLRTSGKSSSLNYKNYYHDAAGYSTYCDEYETSIDHLDQAQKIFAALNIKPLVVVDKTREIWTWENYEIALDTVKHLGDFVEVEYKGQTDKTKVAKITKDMISFLKSVGCGKLTRDHRGYPFKLLFPSEGKTEII